MESRAVSGQTSSQNSPLNWVPVEADEKVADVDDVRDPLEHGAVAGLAVHRAEHHLVQVGDHLRPRQEKSSGESVISSALRG